MTAADPMTDADLRHLANMISRDRDGWHVLLRGPGGEWEPVTAEQLVWLAPDDAEVWIPPLSDCMERRPDKPCPHCGGPWFHHRTRRCGDCGRRP